MHTSRLILRQETEELLEMAANYSQEKQLAFFGAQDVYELAGIWEKIRRQKERKGLGVRKWHLIDKQSGKVIGSAGFHNWIPEHRRAEVGYYLHADYRRNGLMLEAMDAIVAHGFRNMDLHRIEALIDPENTPSINLIGRLGFTKEGVLREHYHHKGVIYDSVMYSLLLREFTATVTE